MSKSTIAQLEKETLKRKLAVGDLFAIGYGDIGSSIYYALGVTAAFALGATPIALFLAGIIFLCTALTYAEMIAALQDSGGSATFSRRAFNDLISFMAGWGLLLDYIITIAISVFSIGPYLTFIHASLSSPFVNVCFSSGLLAILFLMNVFGVKHSTRISLVLTGLTLITQLIIIFLSLFGKYSIGEIISHLRINVPNANWSPTWPEFWKGTAMAMVAYIGIESIAQLGGETKNPVKTLPRAVVLVMWVLVVIYLGTSFGAFSTVSPRELGTTYINNPLAGIAANLSFGKAVIGPWIGLLAAVLLFIAANAGLLGASRLAFNMGEYYQLPRFFYRVHPKSRTPIVSLATFAILALVVLLVSRGVLKVIADLYNFGAMIAFFSAHVSLIVLRIKEPKLERPFRAPFNISIKGYWIPLTAVIGALGTFSVWVLVVITKPEGRYVGFLWMILGVCMYLAYRRYSNLASAGSLQIERIRIPEYRAFEVKKILVPLKDLTTLGALQTACELAQFHGAKIFAVHILEVPYSIPLDAPLSMRHMMGETILRRAEAIARESDVQIETSMVRSRGIDEAILQLLSSTSYDLLIISAEQHKKNGRILGKISERLLRKAPCRVLIYSSAV